MQTPTEARAIESAMQTATRGRKPMPTATTLVVETDLTPVVQAVAAADARAERVRAIALQVGYLLPGDGVDADLIQRDIAANMRRSVEACLEVGKGLCALKEACEHGEFGKRLEILGIEDRVSRRFMLAADRFSNRALAPVLKAAGNQSKLFELLVLEDEEVQELAAGGEARGLDADAIAGMTRNELRAALAEHKAQLAAKDKVLADNATKINEQAQALELARSAKFTPPPRSVARTKEEQALLTAITQATGRAYLRMHAVFTAADAALSDSGGNAPEAIQQVARQSIEFLVQQLADMAQEFNISVDLENRIRPDWLDEDALAVLEARNATAQ